MFAFTTKDGWKEIEDFLSTVEAKDGNQELVLAGFSSDPSISIGDTDANSFCVFVYSRDFVASSEMKNPEYEFLVEIAVGGICNYVATPVLPDLLELLRQVIPLSNSIDEWTIKKDKHKEELEKKIHG
jgi:hypothetical protein